MCAKVADLLVLVSFPNRYCVSNTRHVTTDNSCTLEGWRVFSGRGGKWEGIGRGVEGSGSS